MKSPTLSRKELLLAAGSIAAGVALPKMAGAQPAQATPQAAGIELTIDDLKVGQKLAGLSFSDEELEEILPDVKEALANYEPMRKEPISNGTDLATVFVPLTTRKDKTPAGQSVKTSAKAFRAPSSDEDMAFLPLSDLATLVRTKQVTSTALTKMYLGRLRTHGAKLQAVVTLLPDQAMAEAHRADEEIRNGKYRGTLHGIPTGVKDLFALRGAPTTWGAAPYKDQVFDYDAAVVEKLRAAGAVICAKLTLGALAQGDRWFGGQTKNPWNTKQGSSGSSAGSASCVSAGLLPYAIGTETLGSVVSPSNQCRVTGLRPTFGRISRYGAMTLCWTMDKVGVLARCAEDTAIVLAALAGADPRDRSTVDRPFHYRSKIDIKALKIGYLLDANEDPNTSTKPEKLEILQVLRKLGANLQPISITPAKDGIFVILEVEAATAFDEFTRSERIKLLKDSNWPKSFRAHRFVPGVELLQAYRDRALLMERFERELGEIDVLVAAGRGGPALFITNLTGHPQVLLPWGTDEKGNSMSFSLIGRVYEEDTLIAVANAIQEQTAFHTRRPDLTKL
jgi:Asp-tRNA(Asn)/Glu-tRNA(Gln) amidotransferase A subunit family amidase